MSNTIAETPAAEDRRGTAYFYTGRRLSQWWSAPLIWRLLLLLATLAVLIGSYRYQPPLSVNIGGEFDRPFVQGFNDSEFTASDFQQRLTWPQGVQTLALQARASGDHLIIVETAEQIGQRLPLSLAATVNGQGVATYPLAEGKGFQVMVPARIVAESGGSLSINIGVSLAHTRTITPITPMAAIISPLRSYRWSSADSRVLLPGVGAGHKIISLRAVVYHPDGSPVEARLWAGERLLAALPERPDTRTIRLLVPAEELAGGDLELRLTARPFEDPRQLGLLLEDVSALAPASTPLLPPLWQLLFALLLIFGADLALSAAGLTLRQRALPLLAILALGAWSLSLYRFPMTIYLPRLAAMVVLSLLLVIGLRALVPKLFLRGGVMVSPFALNLLLLLFLAGFWVKAGGMLYPYMTAIDVGWHMDKVRRILNGELAALYQPGAFSQSVMPIGEWGENPPVIPYSPFFHIFSTSFALFPWPLEISASVFSAIVDNSRVLILFFIARRVGLRERVGLIAAGLYAVLPVTFLLHSWGNVPTTFGLWWALLTTAFILGAWGKLQRRAAWLTLTALLTCTMLFYTVAAVFMTLTLLVWLPLLARLSPDEERQPGQVRAVALSWLSATGLSLLIYYWQYLGEIVNKTIPYFMRGGSDTLPDQYIPMGEYLGAHIPRLYHYGMLIPLIVGVAGLALSWRQQRGLVLWGVPILLVGALFIFIARHVSMTDKHLFYTIPVLLIGAAVVLNRLWESHLLARALTFGLCAYLGVMSLDLWLYRIEIVR